MYRIGIDLGGTTIAVGIVDEANCIVASATTPTRASLGPEQVADDIVQCIMNGLTLSGIEPEECLGIGIGSPGTCDCAAGIVRNAHNLGWENVPVCEMLRSRLNLPVYLANDADCAALGELTAGAAQGRCSALLITLGTGVGGGFVADGSIWSGHRGLGGEFGHMCICMDGALCTCGEHGCWEAYASASALVKQAAAAAESHPESVLNQCAPLDGKAIYAAASAGDPAAVAVTENYARYVAIGLVNLVNALYPEIILLSGGIAGAGSALLNPVQDYVNQHFFQRGTAILPEIQIAACGDKAGVIGAAALVRMR